MRYLVISDIHGNIEALRAVIAFVRRKKYSGVLFLGDLVGYGAAPNQVVDTVQRLRGLVCVRGNHDKVCSGIEEGYNFNDKAKIAADWTFEKLSMDNLKFIREMPRGPVQVNERIVLSHGSPANEDYYLFSEFDAFQVFNRFSTHMMFFGHTHVPCVFDFDGTTIHFRRLLDRDVVHLDPTHRYLINPGSVGQPRDRDYRASSLILDSDAEKLYYYRVHYNVEAAQNRILAEGLPYHLAARLSFGV